MSRGGADALAFGIAVASAVFALAWSVAMARGVARLPAGDARMRAVAAAIGKSVV